MRLRSPRPYLLALAALFLVLPAAASAQFFGDVSGATASISISVSPQYPVPNGQATLSFVSSGLDLANSTMTVVVAGKNIYKGAVHPLPITLGKAGSATNVSVTVSSGGKDYTQTLSIRPQDVALVAEPIASIPALYPGKSSVPFEGNVRVVAVANLRGTNGKTLDPTSLSYTWKVDGVEIANSSGIGKETIIVASPLQYRTREVLVTVASSDGSVVGGADLLLSATDPFIRIYENDPLLGIRFERAISGNYAVTGTESTLYAAPFGLPITNGPPFVQWFLNGVAAQTGNSITLRPTGSGRGSASLSLVASFGSYTKATTDLSLSFGAKPGFNLFGL